MQPAQTLRPTYQDGRLVKGSPGTEVPEGKLDMVTHLHEVREKKKGPVILMNYIVIHKLRSTKKKKCSKHLKTTRGGNGESSFLNNIQTHGSEST